MHRDVKWISTARFQPFLDACVDSTTQDETETDVNERAWLLYEWNARVSSALLECIHHTEVLLRNSMMAQLEQIHPLAYPWQLSFEAVKRAALKKRDSTTKTADPNSVVAELTLGFWSRLLGDGDDRVAKAANEELWRHHLRHAFPGSPGTRSAVSRAVSDLQVLRNRCAHQDSLLDFDPKIEVKKLLTLVEWISTDARTWIESIETVSRIADERPVQPQRDVVVVAAQADEAVAMYQKVSAYVCPADRYFATVDYFGFYCDKQILGYFPRIEDVLVPTLWNTQEAQRLAKSACPKDQKLARVMGYALNNGWVANQAYKVYLLSDKNSSLTIKRRGDEGIPHYKTGRGSAFVQFKRYFHRAALLRAGETSHLD